MSEQNWIVTLKKQSYLEETQILTAEESIAEVIIDLLDKYAGEYTEQDSITIRPTAMKYHV